MTFTTKLRAIDPNDGELKLWFGPNIQATTKKEAEEIVNARGMGYLTIAGRFVEEADWDDNLFSAGDPGLMFNIK